MFRLERRETGIAKRRGKNPFLLLAVCLSVAAGVAVYSAFASVYQPAEVVVAAKDLEALHKIEAEDVKVVQVSRRDRHPSSVSDPKSVVGAFTAAPVVAGEAILEKKIIRDPDKMLETFGSAGPNDTVLMLKSGQVSWPNTIKGGDYVSVVAVYPDRVEDLARSVRVAKSSSPLPVIGELKSAKEAEARPTSEIFLVLDREAAKKVLQATVSAKAVHILPETASAIEKMKGRGENAGL